MTDVYKKQSAKIGKVMSAVGGKPRFFSAFAENRARYDSRNHRQKRNRYKNHLKPKAETAF